MLYGRYSLNDNSKQGDDMASPLEKEENLGVIVKKHESGIRETNQGHKFMTGNIGDTLMRGTDRKCYIAPKGYTPDLVALDANAASTETAAQKKARLKAEAKARSDEAARLKKEEEDRLAQEQADKDAAALAASNNGGAAQ